MDQSASQPKDARIAPPDEYGVPDTSRDPLLDQIVALAATLCEAPMSALNFIDDHRQWTKAAVGFDARDVPREVSICAYTVREARTLIVSDLAEDARFNQFPQVAGAPSLRFYAGVPLEMPAGHRIGTLCILDHRPRHIAETQQLILQSLARHAATELELRVALAAERRARQEAERLLVEKDELLARNDVLMREVDHRVKNSLQLVASMLNLQARNVPDKMAAQALQDAQQRIGGIAAVHDQLYRASDTDLVEADAFLKGLCASLAANRPASVGTLHLAADKVTLNSKRAMKLGLLVTELVTNAFKHAYPAGREGDIRVALIADDRRVRLVVSDDGVGLPPGFSTDGGKGLGMRLIRSVLGQFGGTITLSSGPGATFVVDMPRSSSMPT